MKREQLERLVHQDIHLRKSIENSGGLDRLLHDNNCDFSVSDMYRIVAVYTSLQVCEEHCTVQGCVNPDCDKIHICKFHLISRCDFKQKKCNFGHSFDSDHNTLLLRTHGLENIGQDNLKVDSQILILPKYIISPAKGCYIFTAIYCIYLINFMCRQICITFKT